MRQNAAFCGNGLNLSQTTILDPSKLKEFADDNLKLYKNDGKFSNRQKIVTSYFSFSHRVFEKLAMHRM